MFLRFCCFEPRASPAGAKLRSRAFTAPTFQKKLQLVSYSSLREDYDIHGALALTLLEVSSRGGGTSQRGARAQ